MRHLLSVHFVIRDSSRRSFSGFSVPFFFYFQGLLTVLKISSKAWVFYSHWCGAGSYSTGNFITSFKSACSTEFNLDQIKVIESGHIVLEITIFLAVFGNIVGIYLGMIFFLAIEQCFYLHFKWAEKNRRNFTFKTNEKGFLHQLMTCFII